MATKTAKKTGTKPVVKPAASAAAPAPAEKKADGRSQIRLIETTPNKLASAIGGDTPIQVSRKCVNDILAAKAGSDLIAEAGL